MSTSRRSHQRGLSLASAIFLAADHCLASPLLFPRNQGTAVLSADAPDTAAVAQPIPTHTAATNPSKKNPATMIVLGVALASLALTVPMFVYIWIRQRRLHATRAQSRKQQQQRQAESKAEFFPNEPPIRKGSVVSSTVEVPLTAAMPVGRARKESVTFSQPVRVSVKPIRAVEITVKPTRMAVFRDPSWEKL